MPDSTAPFSNGLSEEQIAVLRVITPISATFGLLGSLITIFGFLAFRHLRTTIARLIFCMAVADFAGILAKALGRIGPSIPWLCQVQGALMQWGDLSSIFWTVMISLNLLFIMYWKKAVDDVKRYEKWYITICYLAPIPMSILPLFIGRTASGQFQSMYRDSDLW